MIIAVYLTLFIIKDLRRYMDAVGREGVTMKHIKVKRKEETSIRKLIVLLLFPLELHSPTDQRTSLLPLTSDPPPRLEATKLTDRSYWQTEDRWFRPVTGIRSSYANLHSSSDHSLVPCSWNLTWQSALLYCCRYVECRVYSRRNGHPKTHLPW